MNGFTFYKSFYDTICKIRKKQDRASVALAVLEFMFEDSEPQGLSETGEIAFESFKHTLNTAKSKGMNGGTKRSESTIKSKSNENQMQIKNETKDNQNEIKTETRLRSSLSIRSITPPFIPPQGEKTNEFEDRFFEKYPKYAKSKGKTEGIDFEKLLVEFEKSKYLQSLYTFKQVKDIYEGIIQGLYRDKTTPIDDANARAERERWYANRRNTAINRAESIKDKLMQRKDFFDVNGKLAEFPIALARAAISGDEGLEAKLQEEEKHWQGVRDAILEEEGYTSEDLLPKWHCAKCEDTGFLASGKACDCYGGEND